MLIDAHAHLWLEENYAGNMLKACDELGIEKVCVSGLGDVFAMPGNDTVAEAVRQFPDRLIGFYFVRLGHHSLDDVDKAVAKGFKGLKFTIPLEPYDHESYFTLYERAQAYGLPCLFHAGVVTTQKHDKGISSAKMRPIHLDAIAREFPRLPCICAHLGMPWYEEAAAVARILPNVYLDITGAPSGWRLQKDTTFFRSLFYWPGAWHKVLWGSDVHYTDLPAALERDHTLVEELGLSAADKRAFFGGTLTCLLPAD